MMERELLYQMPSSDSFGSLSAECERFLSLANDKKGRCYSIIGSVCCYSAKNVMSNATALTKKNVLQMELNDCYHLNLRQCKQEGMHTFYW